MTHISFNEIDEAIISRVEELDRLIAAEDDHNNKYALMAGKFELLYLGLTLKPKQS